MPGKYEVRLDGGVALLRKLHGDVLLGKPMRKLLLAMGMQAKQVAYFAAPRGATGRLAKGIGGTLSPKPIPTGYTITVKARNPRDSYRYANALEFGAVVGRKRRDGQARARNPHQHWLKEAIGSNARSLFAFVQRGAAAIEAEFRGGGA